jgi:hypothetical protein
MKLSTMTFAMCFALAPFAAHAGMRVGGGGMGGGMGGTHEGGMGAMSAGMGGEMTPWGGGMNHDRGTQCPHARLKLKQALPLFSWLSPCGVKF